MSETLTPRQAEIYEFIVQAKRERRISPTFREIGKRFDIKSPNGVIYHLDALQKKGYIRRDPLLSRSIVLVDDPDSRLAERIRAERDALLAACRAARELIAANLHPWEEWQCRADDLLVTAIEGVGG